MSKGLTRVSGVGLLVVLAGIGLRAGQAQQRQGPQDATAAPVDAAATSDAVKAVASNPTTLDADYERLVATYRRGDIVTAVGEVARWPEERIRAARGKAKAAPDHMAKALAMIHIEAAFALRPDRRADQHLATAEAFVDGLPDRDADGFVARWRVLAANYDVMRGHMSEARVRLRRARDKGVHSRHAELMLVALEEMNIRRRLGGRVRGDAGAFAAQPATDLALWSVEAGGTLAPAYGRVVEKYPDFLAARLRWGWALYITHSSNARTPLETVASQAKRPDLRYLAHLFLGAVAERENRLDDARRAYEAAVAATAQQSALIGLIAVAGAVGDQARVQQAARALQGLSPADGEDPWTYYNSGFTGDELLVELRAEAARS